MEVSSPIAHAEATQAAQHPAITVDVHRRGATAAVALLDGVAVLVLAVVPQVGEVAVAVLLAGEVTADAQPTAAAMEAGQLTVEQQHTAARPRTEAQPRMVEALPTAVTMATVLHTAASTLVVAHPAGEALVLATQHRSRISPPLRLELTTLLHQARMPRRHPEGMVHTLHPHLVAQWMLLLLATTLHLLLGLDTARHQQSHRRLAHGTSRHPRRAARIRDTTERHPNCTIEVSACIRYHLTFALLEFQNRISMEKSSSQFPPHVLASFFRCGACMQCSSDFLQSLARMLLQVMICQPPHLLPLTFSQGRSEIQQALSECS